MAGKGVGTSLHLISRDIRCPCGWTWGPSLKLREGEYFFARHKAKCEVLNNVSVMDLTDGKVVR